MPRIDTRADALLVVDLQNDFCPGGALAVPGGDEIVAPVRRLATRFDHLIATQDWHPPDHASFASQHPGREPFQTIDLHGTTQVLWPDHCVQGTPGAELHAGFDATWVRLVVRKGLERQVDSYSAFMDNDRTSRTGLAGALRELGIARVFLCGLALDFCVAYSAIDAVAAGFEAYVVRDACRAIDQDGSLAAAEAAMRDAGVPLIASADLEGWGLDDNRAGVPRGSALLTDLYQLTMMNGYLELGEEETRAAFDLSFRRLPFGGSYLLAAGLEDAVRYLEELVFTGDEIEYLRSLGLFGDEFFDYLAGFRFSGDVFPVPEGTPVFPREPVLRVEAPLLEAQLVETALLNIVGFQTLIATKAARVMHAADGDEVVDFGLRRAHGTNGAFLATRAAFIGGAGATSNVLAGRRLGIPVRGTMAHSWVLSFDSELEAFRAYADVYPDSTILLLDTFDTLESGLPNALIVAEELREQGHALLGVRLDSGDLKALSVAVREQLDEAGLRDVTVFASGDLDEQRIGELKGEGARIDAWGVGTRLITAHGDPGHSAVYKLAAVQRTPGEWQPRHKVSDTGEKATLPGRKQVWRLFGEDGFAESDVIALVDENLEHGEADALLVPVIVGGERVDPLPALEAVQVRARAELEHLAPEVRRIEGPESYFVEVSAGVEALRKAE